MDAVELAVLDLDELVVLDETFVVVLLDEVDAVLELVTVEVSEVVSLIRRYDFTGQRRGSFEYTMFSGVNDDKVHADALYRLLRGLECRVNLIRFHKIPDSPLEPSPAPVMQRFMERLNNHGITCTIRASRGEDIYAACGLLAGKHKEKEK